MATIDMQAMRYINLLDKVSHVRTRKCFVYNNIIYFAVPVKMISKAIGPSALNIKKIQDQIGKKVRIIREANDTGETKRFIEDVVTPVKIKSLEIKENCIVVTAGSNQNKAVMIGRNKRRFEELKKIMQDVFQMDLKII
jgi:NusA-like KH domain protein